MDVFYLFPGLFQGNNICLTDTHAWHNFLHDADFLSLLLFLFHHPTTPQATYYTAYV